MWLKETIERVLASPFAAAGDGRRGEAMGVLEFTGSVADAASLMDTPENRARELRGLLQAAGLPGANGGKPRELLLLTQDQEDCLTEQGLVIQVTPAWRWLD